MMNLNEITGRFTIVGFNDIGFPISWDTNIRSVEMEGSNVVIIHKPVGKKNYFKHTYDKLNHTRIYKGWLKESTLDLDFISFDESCLSLFDKYESKKVFSF